MVSIAMAQQEEGGGQSCNVPIQNLQLVIMGFKPSFQPKLESPV